MGIQIYHTAKLHVDTCCSVLQCVAVLTLHTDISHCQAACRQPYATKPALKPHCVIHRRHAQMYHRGHVKMHHRGHVHVSHRSCPCITQVMSRCIAQVDHLSQCDFIVFLLASVGARRAPLSRRKIKRDLRNRRERLKERPGQRKVQRERDRETHS